MAAPLLRPLTYGELLDEVVDLYRSNALLFFSIVAVVQIPWLLLSWAIGLQHMEPKHPFATNNAIFLVANALVSMLVEIALLAAGSNRYLGRRARLGSAYRFALRRYPLYVWAKFLQYLMIFIGMILLLVPGIIIALNTVFLSITITLENLRLFDAVERSRYLAGREGDRIFVFYCLVTLFIMTFSLQPELIARFLVTDPQLGMQIRQIWGAVSGLFFYPLWACASLVFYYDVRVRKEAFDVHLQTEALASG